MQISVINHALRICQFHDKNRKYEKVKLEASFPKCHVNHGSSIIRVRTRSNAEISWNLP